MEKQDCSRLSGGEKQQVGLLRALMGDEKILLLDEPFSAMSPELELEYTKTLLETTDKTVVMISHNRRDDYAELFDEVITIG
ncbi:MAG: ATP-binding cassette domain-containing protein [Lachnospiraceae bacterium]|nr:ATP-binding cassette domain-containing protein [Lachnospiraceae bacterium]